MAGLPNFVFVQRPGLAQQNKYGKNITIINTFWDFLEAECSNQPLNWQVSKIETLQFHQFFFWLQQTQTETFVTLEQSGNYTQTFFSSNQNDEF